MNADFCDVGFNDSAQTFQTIQIFVKIALSEAKVFLVPTSGTHDCLLQLIKRDNGVMHLLQCIDNYWSEYTEYANVDAL